MKKIYYQDEWGYIVEYTKYRGKRGRFVTDKYGRTLEKRGFARKEITQWRIVGAKKVGNKVVGGKRVAKIMVETPDKVMKTTYPGAVGDFDGDINEAIRTSNVFTEIHKARTALINVRGLDPDGYELRFQSRISVGKHHQRQQLVWAVKELLAFDGFRTNYELSVIRSPKIRRQAASLVPLRDVQITITLFR